MRVKTPWVSRNINSWLAAFIAITTAPLAAQSLSSSTIIREEFDSLSQWKPLLFPKIERHSTYEIKSLDSTTNAVQARSDSAASALVWNKQFDIYRYPILRWRWKVNNLPDTTSHQRKSGDDYSLRVFILFEYDPDSASLITRAKYEAAKLAYGEYPPAASLNYVWSSVSFPERVLTSPYTDATKLIALQSGDTQLGEWREEEVHLLEDFRAAFGKDPPQRASLAIMTDSDNTQSVTEGFIDYLELRETISGDLSKSTSVQNTPEAPEKIPSGE